DSVAFSRRAAGLRPTREFDGWQMQSLSEQWAVVAEAWFERHDASGRTWLKRLVLDAFGDPADGRVIALADVQRWLAWHRPRRPTGSDRAVTTMLEQAAWIGITGVDALSSFGPTVDVKALDALLPQRVDHVVIQADLTAIAPGPLTPEAAHDLGTIADVESRGGATVYRISPESLRRAHGLGWTVSDLVETLQQRSRTPLPQALGYLINDLSRLPAAGTATFRDPSMRHRSPARGAPASADEQTTPEDRLDLVLARDIVAVLRSEGAAGKPRQTDHAAPDLVFDSPLATLREAVETGEVLWVGYVDATGASTERLVKASAVDDGLLQAHDARSREEFTVPVHRVTAAHIIRSST
ncbi:MAG: helicase-associated domain-containing protein, partial [Nocardioidaceae bacterium]